MSSTDPSAPPASARGQHALLLLECFVAGAFVARAVDYLLRRIQGAAFGPNGQTSSTPILSVMLATEVAIMIGTGFFVVCTEPGRGRSLITIYGVGRLALIAVLPIIGGIDLATPWYHAADFVTTLPALFAGAWL